MWRAILIASCIGVTSCASTEVVTEKSDKTPQTAVITRDALGRDIGKLRRLVLLPVVLKYSPENAEDCYAPCDVEVVRETIFSSVASYLTDWKGYEILVEKKRSETNSHSAKTRLDQEARRIAELLAASANTADDAELRAVLKHIAATANAHGAILITGNTLFLSKTEAALVLGSGTLYWPFLINRLGTHLDAKLFESATGRIVWGSRFYTGLVAPQDYWGDYGEGLFWPIETALPAGLIQKSVSN